MSCKGTLTVCLRSTITRVCTAAAWGAGRRGWSSSGVIPHPMSMFLIAASLVGRSGGRVELTKRVRLSHAAVV
ncbi:uncharacterized protein LY79DRAFT_534846 [Colletotrichum navitas]|uniref:Uncharacterized protein n=1 Tax=Colletotrichum navitas TaxID=681940 RepID=A0AAD8QB15_9PEZI|nr:uncharacterized protein LY79DRAFT_534846 [Colletotrichum navitas]KAK1599355.1 hypothetical protein LY79DRAFT_534846 [Colletotrichum navitas]